MAFAHQNVAAQSQLTAFDYGEKMQRLELAKAGDAESLFLLGLAHYHGQNASNDPAVAERFFHFAAQNGSQDAVIYLEKLRSARPKTQDVHHKRVEAKFLDAKVLSEVKVTTSLDPEIEAPKLKTPKDVSVKQDSPKQEDKRVLSEQALETEKLAEVSSDFMSDKNEGSYNQTQHHSRGVIVKTSTPIKAEVRHNVAALTHIDDKSMWFSVWRYIAYTFFAIVMLAAFIIFGDLIFQVPLDFRSKHYLALNPDVDRSGMGARLHYVCHGKAEGRPYKR